MNTHDMNKIVDKLYYFMADDLSDPNGGWVHGPKSFLPTNVCCDHAGMMKFKKKLYDILAHEFVAYEKEKLKRQRGELHGKEETER